MRPVQFSSPVQAPLPLLRPQPFSPQPSMALRHDPRHDEVSFGANPGRIGFALTFLFLAGVGLLGVNHVRNRNNPAQQRQAQGVDRAANPPANRHRVEPTVSAVITRPGQEAPIASILYNAERDTLDVFAGDGKTNGQWDPKKYKGEVNAQGMVFPLLGTDPQTGVMAMSSNPIYLLDPHGFFRAIGGEKKAPGQPMTFVSLRLGEVDNKGTVHRITGIRVRPAQANNPKSDSVVDGIRTEVAGRIQRTDGKPLDLAYNAAAAYAALVVEPDYQNPFLRPGKLEDIPNVERTTIGKK